MTVVFYNPGLMDVRAFTTFGINAKTNDSAIGYFGTGLKYAIAVLLREGCEVHAHIGNRVIRFTKSEGKFRDKEFAFVHMIEDGNVTELPFTLELGKNWKLWMAYRELYSNALDEGGNVGDGMEIAELDGDSTYFVVTGPGIEKVHAERSKWFIQGDRRMFYSTEEADVYEGATYILYNKGICVRDDLPNNLLFTYNIKSRMTLSEDRRAQYSWECDNPIMRCIAHSDNKDFIRRVLKCHDDAYEAHLAWDIDRTPSATFLEVFDELTSESVNNVRLSIRKYVMKHTGKDTLSVENIVEIDEFEQLMLDKAKAFIEELGMDMSRFPIIIVKDKENLCGMADMEKRKIYINKDTFRRGTLGIAATLYEEYTHLDTGYNDETYEMQTHYLMRALDYAQRWKGVVL